jgi:(p)ppGpp synthase/HD superfamily hydrolase
VSPQVQVTGPRRCPRCQSTRVVPIEYGLPPVDIGQEAGRGDVILGGRRVSDGDPTWHCRHCGAEFGHFRLDDELPGDELELPPTATPSPLGPRFADALRFAARAHAAQTRKGKSTPYVAHLLAVTAMVIEAGGDEDAAIAALLHDAVEDQGGRPMLERIRRRFGERVAGIVLECTDAEVVPKPPWRERKEAYVAGIAHKSREGLLVSLCDKIHNAREILADYREHGEALWDRFAGGRAGTLWYYRTLADALREGAPRALWRQLEETVAELERLAGATRP